MPNDTRSRNPIMAWFGPAFILILLCSASAQITADSSMTENHDATWGRSTRVTQTRVEVGGRTIATQIVEKPSVNGDYTLVNAIETETSHDGAKNHMTER